MAKGLDLKFLHYGICEKYGLDFDWMSEEILRKFHAAKVDKIEISDSDTENIISAAIQLVKQ